MRRLVPCPQCNRHVFPSETTCPHCGKAAGGLMLAAAVGAGLALAACSEVAPPMAVYGPPPVSTQDRTPTVTPVEPTATATSSSSAAPGPSSSSSAGANPPAPTSSATSSATATSPPTPPNDPPTPAPVYGPPPKSPLQRPPSKIKPDTQF